MALYGRKLFLRDFLTALFRQARVERRIFACIVGATLIGNYVVPSVFESHATLLVVPRAGEEASPAAVRDEAMRLLVDEDFLRVAVDHIGVQRLQLREERPLVRILDPLKRFGAWIQLVPGDAPIEHAVAHLQHNLTVQPGMSDRLIRLSFTATDATFAQAALQQLSDAFVEMHKRPNARRAARSTVSPGEELIRAEAAVDAFMSEHDPDELERQYADLVAQGEALRERLRTDRDVAQLQQLGTLDAEAARIRGLLDELERLEDELLAISASVELSGAGAPPSAAPMARGPVAFSLVTHPTLPVLPVSPQRLRNLLHSVWIGVVAAFAGALIVQWLDHRILFPEDLEQRMGVPVLGSSFAADTPENRAVHLQQLCGRLRNPPGDLGAQVWLITSAHEGTGALPMEIATTLAEDPTARVLHVDLHTEDALTSGFGDVLLDRASLDDVLIPTQRNNQWKLPRGAADYPNPLFLAAETNARHWQALRERFSDIVVNAPPILDASETLAVANLCDAVLIVVQAERVRREVVARACEVLAGSRARIGGAMLINRRRFVPRAIYTRI